MCLGLATGCRKRKVPEPDKSTTATMKSYICRRCGIFHEAICSQCKIPHITKIELDREAEE